MSLRTGHLFDTGAVPSVGEAFTTLLAHRNLVIERIVSSANMPPVEFRQSQDEWVLLVRGEATLVVDGQRLAMGPGDPVFLPARVPHTVLRVTDGALWLAVHLPVG